MIRYHKIILLVLVAIRKRKLLADHNYDWLSKISSWEGPVERESCIGRVGQQGELLKCWEEYWWQVCLVIKLWKVFDWMIPGPKGLQEHTNIPRCVPPKNQASWLKLYKTTCATRKQLDVTKKIFHVTWLSTAIKSRLGLIWFFCRHPMGDPQIKLLFRWK